MDNKKITVQVLFTLLILTIKRAICHRPYIIEFNSLQYEYNKERVKIFDLKIVNYNNHSALNATVVFSRDIHDFYMDFKALVPKGKRRSWVLINTTVNGCEFLKGIKNKNLNLVNIIYNELRRFDGFPTKCPVEKDKPIYIPYFYIDSEKSPPYLPVFNITFFLVCRQTDDYLYRANFNFIIVDKKLKI